ncbi:MAG: FAD-binding protein, partial [Defluviitoga tunisiensis]
GIRINKRAETGVKGIYAAGEVTGGMHGADRIGGLSTANALVFGKIAGQNAALFAKNQRNYNKENIIKPKISLYIDSIRIPKLNPNLIIEEVKELMWKSGNVVRNDEQLNYAIKKIKELSTNFQEGIEYFKEIDLYNIIKAKNYVDLSLILLTTMLLREESRGSHFREDYPFQMNKFNKFIVVSKNKKGVIEYHMEAPNN